MRARLELVGGHQRCDGARLDEGPPQRSDACLGRVRVVRVRVRVRLRVRLRG